MGTVRDLADEAADGEGALEGVAVVDALVAHEPAQQPPVADEPRRRDPDVVVDLEDLALEAAELVLGPLEGGQHHVPGPAEPHAAAALLHGLHGVLDLVQPPLRAPGHHVLVILLRATGCQASLRIPPGAGPPGTGVRRGVATGALAGPWTFKPP